MKRKYSFIFYLLLLCACTNNIANKKDCTSNTKKVVIDENKDNKEFSDKIQELILSENNIGIEYFFKVMLKNEVLEYRITYLGNISSSKGLLKFLNSTVYSGLYEDSKRANSRVFLYDSTNNKMGYYYVGGAFDVPSKIQGTDLIFSFNNDECNKTTPISFKDSIPKEIFINCTEKGGNFHKFEKK